MMKRKNCKDCAPRNMVISLRTQKDLAEDRCKILENSRDIAIDACVRLEQELAEAKRENELLKNIIEGLRMRNYELLKENNEYAEVFGLIRYTMEPGIPEDLRVDVSDEELARLRERYGITQTGEE